MQNHPPVPVYQYPGLPRPQIEHLNVQRMHRLHSSSPPPPIQHQPPPLLAPFSAPLPYLHPPQPQRVDYTTRLMQNFDFDYQRRHSRHSNLFPPTILPMLVLIPHILLSFYIRMSSISSMKLISKLGLKWNSNVCNIRDK